MKKRVILIDGNNLLFRSYYATAYNGNFMNNSKGFPTNALFGFVNMLNKIINEEKPEHIMCAFDKGKNFRHDKYKDYKAGRIETPNELKLQFPYAKKICECMGIKYIDYDNYEADDIIGTFARMCDEDSEYDATIISSDKDLLQLISNDVNVKLLKQSGFIFMNEESFFDNYGIKPIRMIDLKSLMGDASDNIPGVKGIGEKTALTLLQKYNTLDGIYEHIDELTPKLKEKLLNDKDMAYYSYDLATIYKTIDFEYTFDDIKYLGNNEKLIDLYKELEFNSFLKSISFETKSSSISHEVNYEIVKHKIDINNFAYYLELDKTNYNTADIIGCALYDGNKLYYLDKTSIILNRDIFDKALVTFDLKKNIVALNKLNIKTNSIFDSMIASYLLEMNTKDDVAYLSRTYGCEIEYYENIISKKSNLSEEDKIKAITSKAKFLFDSYKDLENKLKENNLIDLYNSIEHPLIYVLANMEINGIKADKEINNKLKEDISKRIESHKQNIYSLAGHEFNISSPKQLGVVLFEELNLPHKKNNTSTAHEVLVKLNNIHPIINELLEYRNLTKLLGTYIDTLDDYVLEDGRVHTIYKQNVARTGRLSSIEPNLQNIPVRTDEGKNIRKCFVASDDSVLLSSDYSQIELRVLAHIAKSKSLIDAFNSDKDIHKSVASDIFGIPENEVTSNQRRTAKAVIFGIVYGISGYGLSENLDISMKEAKEYIDKYLEKYPEIKIYQDNTIKEVKDKGYVLTLFNRKRTIEEIHNTNYIIRNTGERIATNTPIQGTAADIIKLAMIKMYEELNKRNLKTKMLLQIHDELVFEVPNSELEIVKSLVKDVMENVCSLDIKLKVEINYGKDLYEAK